MTLARPSRRFATALAHITLAVAVALPTIAVIVWLFWDQLAPFAASNLPYAFDLTALGSGARLAGFFVLALGATIQAYGLLGLRQTFLAAAKGTSLSTRSVKGFQRFAWVSLIMVFFGIFQRTALIAIFSASDPTRQGALDIQLGSNELQALFMALLLVFVARVFAEGKLAKDEVETFL